LEEGVRASEISKILNLSKQLVSYYIHKLQELKYVSESSRGSYKVLAVTQGGKNFLTLYEKSINSGFICRAENVRFIASIISMPSIPVDWKKVQMHNWDKYYSTIGGIKVNINLGNQPTIEFRPGGIDGPDPET